MQDRESLLLAYDQLCRSYHAIREFRAKLLGLLPLGSAGGIFLLLNANGATIGSPTLIVIGVLGCVITIGLYLYEQHNMERCHRLIAIGAEWEEQGLHLKQGQFMMRLKDNREGIVGGARYKLAAMLIYGAVFLGWVYIIVTGLLSI